MGTKLTITACTVDATGTVTGIDSANVFEVMLNPSSIKHNKKINYTGLTSKDNKGKVPTPQGSPAAAPQFKNTGNETISITITIDGTGVVGSFDDVKTQIQNLNNIVYKYDGDSHEPKIVRLAWGSLSFDGRLTSMGLDYTLFKPTGDPLRAKVTLDFTDYTSIDQAAREANMTSPDLTHLVEVKAGDSLPLLCHRIYQNSAYYLEVAKANGITNFRDIKPGTRLNFPPLR